MAVVQLLKSQVLVAVSFNLRRTLVNSYKTDANGLPLPDTYNNADVTSDELFTSTMPLHLMQVPWIRV